MGSPDSPTEMDSESMCSGHTLEQMNRYRNGATEAANLALPCEDAELRDTYLSIARTWTELANKLERELRAKQGKQFA
jgi:monomeric isocitrate dehydrogenase